VSAEGAMQSEAGAASAAVPAAATGSEPITRHSALSCPSDRKYCLLAVLILGAAYLLLLNGHWAPGPDTPFYVSVARNLALGRGYAFNGEAVAKIPPGWPLLLAGAMKISPSFWFLNLVPMACLLASAAIWYRILRRMARPAVALGVTLLSGMLFSWYSAAVDLRSEALFALTVAACALLAYQVSEGRAQWWRIALLCLACIGMIQARYAGLGALFIIAAIIISGQRRFEFNRQWLALFITLAVTLVAFMGTRWFLRDVLPHWQPPIVDEGGFAGAPAPGGVGESDQPPPMISVLAAKGTLAYAAQGMIAGQWLCAALWMPAHIAIASPAAGAGINLFGWFLLAFYGVCLVMLARRRQWIMIGVAIYCGAIIVRWTGVNPRYLMPVSPLLIMALWLGFTHASELARGRLASRFFALGVPLLIASLLACNLALFAVDAYIARGGRYYEQYLAGEARDLVACAHLLNQRQIRGGQVAVSPHYVNLNRTRPNGFGQRGLALLLDRRVVMLRVRNAADHPPPDGPPRRLSPRAQERRELLELAGRMGDGQPGPAIADYANRTGIRYYVYRPPASPWRAWHFRIAWYQRMVSGQQEIPENPGWELYEVQGDDLVRIELPPVRGWPTRVPGM
jgi:hypothetical protein